jgi:cysteinyl-tRNA synthetase
LLRLLYEQRSGTPIVKVGGVMDSDKKLIRRMKEKYVRVKKMGDKWNTYLQVDHQGFSVVEQTTKKRAEFFGKMLAIALARVNAE